MPKTLFFSLWGTLMAGGAGVEYYYEYQTGCTNLHCDDHSTQATKYEQAGVELNFVRTKVPFQDVLPADRLTSVTDDYVLAKEGQVSLVHSLDGAANTITLPEGTWQVKWFATETGMMQGKTATFVTNNMANGVLSAPNQTQDWLIVITKG